MSLDEFLKEKKALEEAQEASKKKDFHDKCVYILGKIKEKSEEKYHELAHNFHTRFNSPNIQRKVIMGFYAQLVAEMKALDPTPMIAQTASNFKKEVKSTMAATKQKAKSIVQNVEKAKKEAKLETKTDKKSPAAKVEKAAAPKKTAKKTVAKAAPKKAAAKPAGKKVAPAAKKKTATGTGKKKTASKRK